MVLICGIGVNDMPKRWLSESRWNCMVYRKWSHMIHRCYSKKSLRQHPTYNGCTVCDRWLFLSNFIEDFKLIEGYNEEKFLNGELHLDKDIKSNGQIKEYSLNNCMLVSQSENNKQATKTRNYNYQQGTSHPRARKVAQYDKQGNLIKIWEYIKQAADELGISHSHISACCRGKRKTCGGYVWKYYEEIISNE